MILEGGQTEMTNSLCAYFMGFMRGRCENTLIAGFAIRVVSLKLTFEVYMVDRTMTQLHSGPWDTRSRHDDGNISLSGGFNGQIKCLKHLSVTNL